MRFVDSPPLILHTRSWMWFDFLLWNPAQLWNSFLFFSPASALLAFSLDGRLNVDQYISDGTDFSGRAPAERFKKRWKTNEKSGNRMQKISKSSTLKSVGKWTQFNVFVQTSLQISLFCLVTLWSGHLFARTSLENGLFCPAIPGAQSSNCRMARRRNHLHILNFHQGLRPGYLPHPGPYNATFLSSCLNISGKKCMILYVKTPAHFQRLRR